MDNRLLAIEDKEYQKIRNWVELAGINEVNGLGFVKEINNQWFVYEALLMPQVAGAAECEFDQESHAKMLYDMIKNDDSRVNDLHFAWHSHGDMKPFWSPQDEKFIENYLSNDSVLFSLVTNMLEKSLVRCDTNNPRKKLKGLNIEVIQNESFEQKSLEEWCQAEFEEKVRFKYARKKLPIETVMYPLILACERSF